MNKKIPLLITIVASIVLSSCNSLRNIFTADLEDEEFYLEENFDGQKTYKRVPTKKQNSQTTETTPQQGKMTIKVTEKDNAKLYREIEKWYGTPYKYGGCSSSGIDCSCFVKTVFAAVYGINLNRGASDMLKDITVVERRDLREGDIIFFANNKKSVSHVGIYLKDDFFAHSSSSKGVTISRLSEKYWDARFFKAGRHKDVTTKW